MQLETRIAVKGVIYNSENKILLIKESSKDKERTKVGQFGVPGGKLEFGENPLIGLRREIKEECGLDVEILQPIHVAHWMPKIADRQLYIVGIFFLCKAKNSNVKISNFEHDDYTWIAKKDMPNLKIMTPDDIAIEKAFILLQNLD